MAITKTLNPQTQSSSWHLPSLSTLSRVSFKGAIQAAGCFIGSVLAHNLAGDYSRPIARQLGTLGAERFLPVQIPLLNWFVGEVTLYQSSTTIETVASGIGGYAGATIAGAAADVILYGFDQTVSLVMNVKNRILPRVDLEQIREARSKKFKLA